MADCTDFFAVPTADMRRGQVMLTSFTCKNFRNIDVEDINFARINLLIGPNNSGKSNFIKALTFFSEMLKTPNDKDLRSSFLNTISQNGWDHMVNKSATCRSSINFSWDLDIMGKPVRYKLDFTVGTSPTECNIISEQLNSIQTDNPRYEKEFNYFTCHDPHSGKGFFSTAINKGKANKKLQFEVYDKETVVMQFKDLLLKDKNIYSNDYVRVNIANLLYSLQEYFSRYSAFSSAQFNTLDIRKPVGTRSLDMDLNKSASNFVSVFNNRTAADVTQKPIFMKSLKALIPGLEDVTASVLYDRLIFRLLYKDAQYDLTDVSEGTIKGLILNMIFNMPMEHEYSLLAIDEPEMNLHPAWQKVVGNWIQNSSNFDQCFISTHSPDFLDSFTDEFKRDNVAVFVFDAMDDNHCRIKKVLYEDIEEELGDWELGDLYRTGDIALGYEAAQGDRNKTPVR